MKITVKKKELLDVLVEVFNELENTGSDGIEIQIDDNKLYFATLEGGGVGCCMDFDYVQGLTKDEICDLP